MAKVFIVDDSKISRSMLKAILEKKNHVIVGEAANGQIALDTYENADPDIIFLDITMPVMDGIDTLRKIKEKTPSVRVVMVTAIGKNNTMVQAIQYGAEDFVTKPVDPDHLYKILGDV